MISQMRNELCVTRTDRLKTCLSTSASRLVLATFLAAGTLVAALPASAAVVNVANEGQLRNAIANAHNGDVINVTANITLSANLPLVKSNVIINGGNFTLSGNNLYRGLYVEFGHRRDKRSQDRQRQRPGRQWWKGRRWRRRRRWTGRRTIRRQRR